MFFFRKKQPIRAEISVRQLEEAIGRFLNEYGKKDTNISYRILFNETGNISYQMLEPFLDVEPINQFVGTRHTFEFFEDTAENREKVVISDRVQEAMDLYIARKEAFPLKDESEDLEISYVKLEPFLEEIPTFPLYLRDDYFIVNISPKSKQSFNKSSE